MYALSCRRLRLLGGHAGSNGHMRPPEASMVAPVTQEVSGEPAMELSGTTDGPLWGVCQAAR